MPTAWKQGELDPALSIECPMCGATRGEYCRSKHAIPIHQLRRAALRNLEAEATRLIRKGDHRG